MCVYGLNRPVDVFGLIGKSGIGRIDMRVTAGAGGGGGESRVDADCRGKAVTCAAAGRRQVVGLIPAGRLVRSPDQCSAMAIGVVAAQVNLAVCRAGAVCPAQHAAENNGIRLGTRLGGRVYGAQSDVPGAQKMIQIP